MGGCTLGVTARHRLVGQCDGTLGLRAAVATAVRNLQLPMWRLRPPPHQDQHDPAPATDAPAPVPAPPPAAADAEAAAGGALSASATCGSMDHRTSPWLHGPFHLESRPHCKGPRRGARRRRQGHGRGTRRVIGGRGCGGCVSGCGGGHGQGGGGIGGGGSNGGGMSISVSGDAKRSACEHVSLRKCVGRSCPLNQAPPRLRAPGCGS